MFQVALFIRLQQDNEIDLERYTHIQKFIPKPVLIPTSKEGSLLFHFINLPLTLTNPESLTKSYSFDNRQK